MHFVNAHGRAKRIVLGAALEALVVGPFELAIVPNDRGVLGRGFEEETVRIGLEDDVAVRVADLVFVERALEHARNKNLPNARGAETAHRVNAAVPVIERADNTHALRIGRPDGETRSGDAINDFELRAKLVVNAPLVAFTEKIEVHLAERR